MHKGRLRFLSLIFLTIFSLPFYAQNTKASLATNEAYIAFVTADEGKKTESFYSYCQTFSEQLSANANHYSDLDVAEIIFFISHVHGSDEYTKLKTDSPELATQVEQNVSSILSKYFTQVDRAAAIYATSIIPFDQRRQLEVKWKLPTGALEGIPLQPNFSLLPAESPEREKRLLYRAVVETNEFFEKYNPRNIKQVLDDPLILWMITCTDAEYDEKIRSIQDLSGFVGMPDDDSSPLIMPAEFNRFLELQLNEDVYDRLSSDTVDFLVIYTHLRWLEGLSRRHGVSISAIFDAKTADEIQSLLNDNLYSIKNLTMHKFLDKTNNSQIAATLKTICHTISYLAPRIFAMEYGVIHNGK